MKSKKVEKKLDELKTVQLKARTDLEQVREIREIARRKKWSVGLVMREALREYAAKHKND